MPYGSGSEFGYIVDRSKNYEKGKAVLKRQADSKAVAGGFYGAVNDMADAQRISDAVPRREK